MKNITRKLKNMGTTIGLGVCSFWALGNSGCQTINPQGEAFLMGLGQAAIYTGVTESVKARVNPNETNVYVQGNQRQESSRNLFQYIDYNYYIDSDLIIGEVSSETRSIHKVLLQSDLLVEDQSLNYSSLANMLEEINLEGCPQEFIKAHYKHIEAWRTKDNKEINKTRDEILRIALKNGVREEKKIIWFERQVPSAYPVVY